ncbi:MAG: hypothetical protein JSV65_03575, partial [Armatimonadota bacterium]
MLTIAGLFASIDPNRALEIARSIPRASSRNEAVDLIVYVVTESDPQRALAMARTVRRKDRRVEALATVLSQLKPGSPLVASVADEAAGIARSIEQRDRRDAALDAIVQDLADVEPDRAMELALIISRPKLRGRAMRCVVRHM